MIIEVDGKHEKTEVVGRHGGNRNGDITRNRSAGLDQDKEQMPLACGNCHTAVLRDGTGSTEIETRLVNTIDHFIQEVKGQIIF